MKFKIGDRVTIHEKIGKAWGCYPQDKGTIIGLDPKGKSEIIFSVKMDNGVKVFEIRGIHQENLIPIED